MSLLFSVFSANIIHIIHFQYICGRGKARAAHEHVAGRNGKERRGRIIYLLLAMKQGSGRARPIR
jgi:hypothetical protein